MSRLEDLFCSNDKGELVNFTLAPGNTDDRTPVPKLLLQIFGKVFADKAMFRKSWQNNSGSRPEYNSSPN